MVKFGGVDFIDFDSQLNDEEKLVRQTAREFVENEVIPVIEKHSREATFPMHLIPQLGEQRWITDGSRADIAVVWAKAEDDRVRCFLVEKGTPGLKAWDMHGKWSLRASVTSGLSFTDCEIPEANLLPGIVGLKGPLSCLNQARYGIGWGALGAAMACYDTALQYAKTRKQFANKPIASHQLVQEKLAWMITEIVKGQLLATHVGRLKDN